MRKKVLTSVISSVSIICVLAISGCHRNSGNSQNPNNQEPEDGSIVIKYDNNHTQNVNPETGAVIITNNNTTINVVGTPLRECANITTDTDGDGVICGPESGVTYAFQSDFGKLGGQTGTGDLDNDINTYDGGTLLYDAYTIYNNEIYTTPIEGNVSENRIEEVYIPTNYIKLTDEKKNASVNEQYNTMRTYLDNICNMQCFASEPDNNPYFRNGKTKGNFVATFVMHFTRGEGESTLMPRLQNDRTDLEYLAVSFRLDVEKVSGDSSKLKFSVPAGTPVDFYGKKHGQSALSVTVSNIGLNSVIHQTVDMDNALTINMAKYFDKLIAKGDTVGISDYAKSILVENAQHPWPVKIYGTLHEIDNNGTIERSFVRNPGRLDAELFGLTTAGAWKHTFDNDPNKSAVKAEKFAIVYPGGNYNTLED